MWQPISKLKWFLLAVVLAVPLLNACGKKGPLYLPENPPAADSKPQK